MNLLKTMLICQLEADDLEFSDPKHIESFLDCDISPKEILLIVGIVAFIMAVFAIPWCYGTFKILQLIFT